MDHTTRLCTIFIPEAGGVGYLLTYMIKSKYRYSKGRGDLKHLKQLALHETHENEMS